MMDYLGTKSMSSPCLRSRGSNPIIIYFIIVIAAALFLWFFFLINCICKFLWEEKLGYGRIGRIVGEGV